MAPMGQRRMHQEQQDRETGERQLEPEREAGGERDQEPELQGLGAVEAGAAPLDEHGEGVAHGEQVERQQIDLEPVRRQQRCQRGEREEPAPAPRHRPARVRRRAQERLARHQPGEAETEKKSAMQIAPEHHRQRERQCRRAILLPRPEQHRDPGDQQRQGQEMRTGEEMGQQHQPRQHRQQHGINRHHPAQQRPRQQAERRGCGERRQQRRPVPSQRVIGEREENVGEPFMGDPGRARHGVGERIRVRHGAVSQDPVPGHHLPEDVGIGEDARARRQRHREAEERDQQRPGEADAKARHAQGCRLCHARIAPVAPAAKAAARDELSAWTVKIR